MIGRVVAPRHIESLKYYEEHPPAIDWTTVFVLGAIGGAFVAAWSGGAVVAEVLVFVTALTIVKLWPNGLISAGRR